jgi:hypothetical protein
MAFLNDAKQLAEQASRSIEQGLDQVRERIDELQRQRRFNELSRELGTLLYRSRLRGTPLDEAEVQRITAEMASIETMPTSSPAPAGPAGRTGPTGPGGTSRDQRDQGTGGPTDPPAQSGGYSLDDV